MFEDRRDAAEADEDCRGRDEEYEIKALRKTVRRGGCETLSGKTTEHVINV